VQGKILQLQVGLSHDVAYPIPAGIQIVCEKPTVIAISGIDKQLWSGGVGNPQLSSA
jgi:large subunit ribosomal protein L6